MSDNTGTPPPNPDDSAQNPAPDAATSATDAKSGGTGNASESLFDEKAIWTIVGTVATVIFVVGLMTWGTMHVLSLSGSQELALENRDVTIDMTNAISRRICACVAANAPLEDIARAAQAGPASQCLSVLPEPPVQPGIFGQLLEWAKETFIGTKGPSQTPWQAARSRLYITSIPSDSSFYGSVAALNHAISDERLQYIRAAEDNGHKAGVFQILIIGIGALTTMVVSLRSMENLLGVSMIRCFSIAAILLSALGTGAASLNSFYAPRETAVRQVRGLVQLKQLHQEIYVYISAERCNAKKEMLLDAEAGPSTDPRVRRILRWHAQLKQIVSGADGATAENIDASRATVDGSVPVPHVEPETLQTVKTPSPGAPASPASPPAPLSPPATLPIAPPR